MSKKAAHKHAQPQKNGVHKDWRIWTAIVLMLAAMVAYVMSGDEQIRPVDPDANHAAENLNE